MSLFRRGWVKNARPFSHTFSGVHALSRAALFGDARDLSPFCAPLFDQNNCGSCTGHATSDALCASFSAAGIPLPFIPSPRGLYALARAETRSYGGDPSVPLSDDGAMPSDLMAAVARWGFGPIGALVAGGYYSDCGSENVNDEPTQGDLQEDARHLGESHAIALGPGIVSDVCAALDGGMACPTGIFVDSSFENWTLGAGLIGAPTNTNDPQGGGHYVDTVAYARAGIVAQRGIEVIPKGIGATIDEARLLAQLAAKLPPDRVLTFFKNSWSISWGWNGYGVCDASAFLGAPTTGDVNAMVARMKESP